MKRLILSVLLLLLPTLASADSASHQPIGLTVPSGGKTVEVSGNLNTGKTMPLDWAAQSSVAAFPGTRFEMFNGNHVLYRVTLPAASQMKITLTPEAQKAINLYALRLSADDTALPPNISHAISGEASYPKYANLGGNRRVANKDNGVRTIEFMSIDRPYTIVIGVAGAQGLAEGGYKMNIELSQ